MALCGLYHHMYTCNTAVFEPVAGVQQLCLLDFIYERKGLFCAIHRCLLSTVACS